MSHLSLETIARLVEDAPASEEAAHLESCAECRAELAAMTEDVHALSLLPDMAAAPDDWESLERRLIDEGLIRTPARRYGGRGMRMLQIAAALTLFVGGSLAGRMTARPEIVTVRAPDVPVTGSEAPPQGALVVESPEQVIAAPVVDRPAAP
jgi:hypothetical protein